MGRRCISVISTATLLLAATSCSPPPSSATRSAPLVSGRSLDHHPAATQPVGSFPANMIASPDGRFVIVTDTGYKQSLWSIDTQKGAGVSRVNFTGKVDGKANGLYYGLAVAPDGTVYAAQGARGSVAVLRLSSDGALTSTSAIACDKSDFPAGLALDERGLLYVANNDPIPPAAKLATTAPTFTPESAHLTEAAIGKNASVAIFQTNTGKEVGRVELAGDVPGTTVLPLALVATRDGRRVYAGSERDGGVYVIDATDPQSPKRAGFIPTGANVDSLLLNAKQDRLYVANAGSDTVSIVDTTTDRVISTVLLRPEIARDLPGATPTGLALSPGDQDTLYVTLGDMNAVGVIDLDATGGPALRGYIPAGWYPTAVAVSPDGKRLFVANAKGIEPRIPSQMVDAKKFIHPLNLIEGVVSTIAVPSGKELKDLTEHALEAARLTPRYISPKNPLAAISRDADKITHVIYVVKENRTYDQVLGDLPQGNGDKGRCIFGRDVTPNLHALAERFVLFDNFYDCGDVSGDGWAWSTQAMCNEYVTRNVPYSYSSRGRRYDYEGQSNDYLTGGFPAKGPDGQLLSDDARFVNGTKPIPDAGAAPGGHLWDLAIRNKLSYRNYGFFVSDGVIKGGKVILPDNFPNVAALQPADHDLAGVTDIDFRKFDMEYPDSEARHDLFKKTGDDIYFTSRRVYGKHHAFSRFAEWNTEFAQMLAKDPSGKSVPALMTLRLCCDHTNGLSPKTHTPRSMVADNDYSIGQLVEAVSHSPIWPHTAIFVIEDDAQNGPDHVDIHRSICFAISPHIKAHSVDHTFQNTVSVIRSMELLLNLPPLNQLDAAAEPIMDWTPTPDNSEAYTAISPNERYIAETGATRQAAAPDPRLDKLMQESATLDFSHADRAPADVLNRIIWASVRGCDDIMPPTPSGPSSKQPAKKKDDDD